MPTPKPDQFGSLISDNIFKLSNTHPVPFDIHKIFRTFDQPSLNRFFLQHNDLGLDLAPFIYAMLVHVAVMLDGAEIFNPDGTGYTTSLNLFLHLVGEPGRRRLLHIVALEYVIHMLGTNKSGLFRAFSNSFSVLTRLFPDFFFKTVVDDVEEKSKTTKIGLVVTNDTELSLYQRLSKRVSCGLYT